MDQGYGGRGQGAGAGAGAGVPARGAALAPNVHAPTQESPRRDHHGGCAQHPVACEAHATHGAVGHDEVVNGGLQHLEVRAAAQLTLHGRSV